MTAGWGRELQEGLLQAAGGNQGPLPASPRSSHALVEHRHRPATHILRSVAMAPGDKLLLDSPLQISPSRAGPGLATLAIFSHVLHNAEVDEHLHIFISQPFPGAQQKERGARDRRKAGIKC